MGAIGALSTAAGALRRNPVIFFGVLAISIVGSLTTIGQVVGGLVPVVVAGVATFLLQPFLLGGVLGMADEGVAGRTSVGTVLREGAANYLTLLGATIIQIVLFAAIGIVWAIGVGVVVLGAGFVVSGGGGAGGGGGGVLGLGLELGFLAFVLLSVLAFLALVYFIQFYDVAVVVDDTGPWEAFKRSYTVVRRNLLSTLGYTLIAQIINLIALVPTFWLLFSGPGGFDPESAAAGGGTAGAGTEGMAGGGMAGGGDPFASATVAELAPELAVTIVLGTLVSSFLITYRVAYYGDATHRERGTGPEVADSVTSGSETTD